MVSSLDVDPTFVVWLISTHVEDSHDTILKQALPPIVTLLDHHDITVNQFVSRMLIELTKHGEFHLTLHLLCG